MLQTEERAVGRKSIAIGTRTDSWPLRFRRALDATIFVAAAGADSAGAQLQIAFAMPTKGLNLETGAAGDIAEVRLRATILDLDGALVATLDTVRRFLVKEPAAATTPIDPTPGFDIQARGHHAAHPRSSAPSHTTPATATGGNARRAHTTADNARSHIRPHRG